MTITYSELYDFAKVCCKIRQEIKGEIIDGTIRQDDFFRMQKQQIDEWCNGADYKVLQPVRYIGPQVISPPICYDRDYWQEQRWSSKLIGQNSSGQ